ncbi:MAG TPA: acyl-CoA dehydrogenase family protein [Myxococcota bacterium]|nr:acyl-CoA dehydrogenase family protein [Myxococcota bacterium]
MSAYLHDAMLLYVDRLVDWDAYYRARRGAGVDVAAERAALRGVLDTCAEIAARIEPLARAGWANAARLEDGKVRLPEHLQTGYAWLRDAGLTALSISEKYGGYELPALVCNLVIQMVARADAALMTLIGLQGGVAEDIERYAPEELRQRYLPRFTSGEVQGAMDLTEPQAGSDLGAITTRASEEGGRFFLDGQKIFITNGGCEVHLVLARDADTFEQSRGTTRGLSLFLCPRTLPDGQPNRVTVERLEHKLWLHGSPTCAMRFERAEAWRIGRKGEGFRAMLDLMNNARLGVAAQGIGIAEAALEEAVRYARERKQFGVPIGDQPLMKNMLARMLVSLEGARALLYRCSALIDRNRAIDGQLAAGDLSEAERSELQRMREHNAVQIRLLTPLAKYLATETCDDITRTAIQVHGGIGFMAETAVGKLHLDGIITTIYEGTSEIQVSFALKEIGKGALTVVWDELHKELDALADPRLGDLAKKIRGGIERIGEASLALIKDFNYALLSARGVAEMVLTVIVATELLRQADVDPRRFDLAASWCSRKLGELDMFAARILENDVSRIERCERIVELWQR